MTDNLKPTITLTIKEAEAIFGSLVELSVNAEDFDWGPAFERAEKKQDEAIKILKNKGIGAIDNAK